MDVSISTGEPSLLPEMETFMMFLLLGFGYISLLGWYRRQRKLQLYVKAVHEAVHSRSVVVTRKQDPHDLSVRYLCRSSPFFSTLASENRTLSKLVEDGTIVLSALSPKMVLCLSSWTWYGECEGAECPHDMYVLLETSSPVHGVPHLQDQEISKHSIAWKSESLSGIVVGCNLNNFINMCEKFGEGTLAVNNCSSSQRLSTVEVKWSLDRHTDTTGHSLVISNRFHSRISTKPPNILIYCGKVNSMRQFQSVHDTIRACVKPDSYTLYHLEHDQVRNTPWQDNSLLLIILIENLCEDVEGVFLNYLNNGGYVLSFGSSLESKVLQKKEIHSHTGLETFSIPEKWENIKCFRGRYVYEENMFDRSDLIVTVMARDKTHRKPVLVGIDNPTESRTTMGKAIFSQLYLHEDPTESANDCETFEELKQNNPARVEMLQFLLSWLGVDCSQSGRTSLTAASLLTVSQDLKTSFLSSLKSGLKTGCLKSPSVTLEFIQADCNIKDVVVSSCHLPVMCTGALQHKYFNQQVYWQNLNTTVLGHVVIYADVLPTTMTLFERLQFSIPENTGLVAIAGRQTTGKGRGGNTWLSPEGCAMFSLHVQVPVNSNLGQRVSFLQHITSLAVVYSVTSMTGYEMVDLKLKWPNDIYYSNKMKIGGVLVNSTMMGPVIHAVIGCGFNVTNSIPTICINDVIIQHNKQHGTRLLTCSTEQLIARTINQIEALMTDFQTHGHLKFCQRYYTAWLHSGSQVKLESEGGRKVTITGLDDYGFLQVQTLEGINLSVQPDGNTFDMMHNLIQMKTPKQSSS